MRDAILSRLGTPQEGFGWGEALVVLTILGVVLSVDWLLGGLLRKAFRSNRDKRPKD